MDVGNRFLQHYRALGYQALEGSSLLDPSVPMTFVMSAGLSQIESAAEQSTMPTGQRYVFLQTCFRHFDLDKVGASPVHLSLFRMGGAFHFGPVSRQQTLGSIWQFLTRTLGFPAERFRITYFQGGVLEGHALPQDRETLAAWRAIGLKEDQIVSGEPQANVWRQGGGISGDERLRKWGLTTEVFYDRGAARGCGSACRPGCPCGGRFIEVANILFIRWGFDQATGALHTLATPFDETVIGVERLVFAASEQRTIFDVPDFAPALAVLQPCAGEPAVTGASAGANSAWIMLDHVRALLFLAADGAPPPGKGGRAGIIRKMVRAVLTHQQVLGIPRAEVIPDLIAAYRRQYDGTYPGLEEGQQRLLAYFADERQRFERTLAKAFRYLDWVLANGGNRTVTGPQGLDLVKRHGVPLVLLEAHLAQKGLALDLDGYRQAHAAWEQEEAATRPPNRPHDLSFRDEQAIQLPVDAAYGRPRGARLAM